MLGSSITDLPVLSPSTSKARSSGRRRHLLASFGALLFLSVFHYALIKSHTREQASPQPGILLSRTSSPDLLFGHRGLKEKLNVDGKYHGECTTECEPTGGILSIAGLIAGQCDCVLWIEDDDNSTTCNSGFSKTCCGAVDGYGGVVLYLFIVFYTFLGLAIICDNYFCESLSKIVEVLKLSDDVAGATFMAAGSSAPELFTSVVTVLITGGSEGLGTITGSAVFNMMIIVGVTAIAACSGGSTLEVWWYPLMRDTIFYVISIILMVIFMIDNKVEWWESLILVLTYFIYIYVMKRNADLAKKAIELEHWWRYRKARSHQKSRAPSHRGSGLQLTSRQNRSEQDLKALDAAAAALSAVVGVPNADPTPVSFMGPDSDPGYDEKDQAHLKRFLGPNPLYVPAFRPVHGDQQKEQEREESRKGMAQTLGTAIQVKKATELFLSKIKKSADWRQNAVVPAAPVPPPAASQPEDPMSISDRVLDLLSRPLEFAFAWTVPDCTAEGKEGNFLMTFTMSIVWIGLLSFVMVDFSTRIGCVLGIPGLLMGLVFIAAGTSVPDALSSVSVGKSGMGDMAVANVLGSNIFNILLGLGLPWFLKAFIDGKPFPLDPNEPIVANVLVLLLYCVVFLVIIHYNNWKLSVNLGKMFFAAHFVFVVWSIVSFYVL